MGRAIKSKHQNENDQRSERGTRTGDGAASPFGPIDAGIEPRPDDGGFELGGRAEAAGERKAGTIGTALQRKHFGAEPGWYPRTPHGLNSTAASVNERLRPS
jgi:hypothetical protein